MLEDARAISLDIESSDWTVLTRVAAEREVPVAELVRAAVRAYVKKIERAKS